MASRNLNDCVPELAEATRKAIAEWDQVYPTLPKPFATCTHRPNDEQAALYNQPTDGKDNNGNGIIDDKAEFVTNAKAGQSKHNSIPSKAVDIAFVDYGAAPKSKGKLDWSLHLFAKFAGLMKKHNPNIKWGASKKNGGDFHFNDSPHFEI